MTDWLHYFEGRRTERLMIDWTQGLTVEAQLRGPLVRSLQRFQVGEQGEGVHLKAGAAATGDADYAAAIALFIAEEQEHARLLAEVLRALGAPLLRGHWSDTVFTLIRRTLGLKMELMVLLIAEMIAKRYYRALDEGTSDAVLHQVFGRIRDDEEGHLAFHCDVLRAAFASRPRPLQRWVRSCWQGLFRAFVLGVLCDHRSVLRAAGVSPGAFRQDCDAIFQEISGRIFVLETVAGKTGACRDRVIPFLRR